jgi:hypothetical protein
MFNNLIAELKKQVPARKKGGGFFSGPLVSIEYGTSINSTQLKNDMHLNNVQGLQNFEVAAQASLYLFAVDRKKLYCKSSYTYAMDPPSESAHDFIVEQHTTSMAGVTRNHNTLAIPLNIIESGTKVMKRGIGETVIGGVGFEYTRLRINLTDKKSIEFNLAVQEEHFELLSVLFNSIQNTIVKDELLEQAERHEKLLEFKEAAEIYKKYRMDDYVIRLREKAKVKQTVVHGDYIDDRDTTYIDDRDTIVRDSVVSKSNIGAGSDDKIAKLEKIAEMKDKGIIDDDEFKQMKKEILSMQPVRKVKIKRKRNE